MIWLLPFSLFAPFVQLLFVEENPHNDPSFDTKVVPSESLVALALIIAQRYRESDVHMDEKVVDFRAKVGSF